MFHKSALSYKNKQKDFCEKVVYHPEHNSAIAGNHGIQLFLCTIREAEIL